MTTTVKIHVNGNYRATVQHTVNGEAQPTEIVNGGEERTLNFRHDATNVFTVTEEYVGDKPAEPDAA